MNQKGSELPLEQAFAKMVNGMENGLIEYLLQFILIPTEAFFVVFTITVAHSRNIL